jgi:hypothetical protein
MTKFLTIAVAAAALSLGSLAVTSEASAGFKHGGHFKGHFHGHKWGHKWHGWHGVGYGFYNPCYWVFKPYYGHVKICPPIY